MAAPCTAATSGFVKVISASFKRACGLPPGPGGFFTKSSRSLPAVNASPAPCQSTTRVRSSFAAPSSKSAMVPYMLEVSAFFFAGRFSWIRRMLPERSATMSGMVLPSPSLELRGALLEERLRPLLLVVRPGAEAEEGRFQGQPFGLARLQSLVHRLDRELHGERSVGKDLLQDRLRTRHQLRGRNDLVHEADAVRLLRGDRCAGKNQLQRPALPTSRGRRCVPPPPGMIPNATSGWPNFACSAAILSVQAMAVSQPPPSAKPLTAAITGLPRFSIRLRTAWPNELASSASIAVTRASSLMSAPAMNALSPAPVRMTPRTAVSYRASSKAVRRSSQVRRFRAFSTFGRFSVT